MYSAQASCPRRHLPSLPKACNTTEPISTAYALFDVPGAAAQLSQLLPRYLVEWHPSPQIRLASNTRELTGLQSFWLQPSKCYCDYELAELGRVRKRREVLAGAGVCSFGSSWPRRGHLLSMLLFYC
jgi:hypothetical protein